MIPVLQPVQCHRLFTVTQGDLLDERENLVLDLPISAPDVPGFLMDGSNDLIEIPTQTRYKSHPFTFFMYFSLEKLFSAHLANPYLVSHMNDNGTQYSWTIYGLKSSNILRFLTIDNAAGSKYVYSNYALEANTPYRLIVRVNDSLLMNMFMEGEKAPSDNTMAATLNQNDHTVLRIGGWTSGSYLSNFRFYGMGFWNRALTDQEAITITSGGNIITDGLTDFWRPNLQDAANLYNLKDTNHGSVSGATLVNDTTVIDQSGRGKHGTVYFCKRGGGFGNIPSLAFQGGQFYVDCGNINANSRTVFICCKVNSANEPLIDFDGVNTISVVSGQLTSDMTSPTYYVDKVETTDLTVGKWHMLVVTSATSIDSQAFKIGENLDGEIALVRVYDRQFTAKEVERVTNYLFKNIGTL